MGVLYIAMPSDPGLRAWLRELDLPVSDEADGRMPTTGEIRAVLDSLTDYTVTYSDEEREHVADISFTADPTQGPWASLAYPRDRVLSGEEACLTFRRGSPEVMIRILHGLAQSCGPLALIPDTGGAPLLVNPSADLRELIEKFNP